MNTKTKPTTAAVASSVAKTPQGKPGAKPAHTPWHWNEETAHRRAKVLDSGNLEVCDVYGIDRETRNTNARLIATAPTMLQALKDLTAQIQLGKLNIRKDFSLMNAHAAATKAIFQAEGE